MKNKATVVFSREGLLDEFSDNIVQESYCDQIAHVFGLQEHKKNLLDFTVDVYRGKKAGATFIIEDKHDDGNSMMTIIEGLGKGDTPDVGGDILDKIYGEMSRDGQVRHFSVFLRSATVMQKTTIKF
jgi:hypothetical protein